MRGAAVRPGLFTSTPKSLPVVGAMHRMSGTPATWKGPQCVLTIHISPWVLSALMMFATMVFSSGSRCMLSPYIIKLIWERIDSLVGKAVYLPCVIALVTGMWQSEVPGLKWDAVDFEHQKLHIRCVRQYIGEKRLENLELNVYTKILSELPGQIERSYPKNKNNRSMIISSDLVELLELEKQTQAKNRTRIGDRYFRNDYVCVDAFGCR